MMVSWELNLTSTDISHWPFRLWTVLLLSISLQVYRMFKSLDFLDRSYIYGEAINPGASCSNVEVIEK